MATAKGALIANEIAKEKCIPQAYHSSLRQRLQLLCKDIDDDRLDRRTGRVRRDTSRQRYNDKISHNNYHFVLTNQPGHFLAYVLSNSPKTASRKKIDKWVLDTWEWRKLFLDDTMKATLDELAREIGLLNNKKYLRMLEQLKPPSQPPTTAALNAERMDNAVFREPKIKAFHNFVGEWLCNYAVAAGNTNTTSTLPGVKAHVSYNSMRQDAVIWIRIGHADQVLERLFPSAVPVARSQEMAYSVADGDGEGEPWFYIPGASVSVFAEVCPQMMEHIAASQLRGWEISNETIERTDCVIMKKSIANPDQGLLRLRFSFLSASSSMNQMFTT
ncbi:hypothetical protein FOPG_17742 [Fusarium oxysporum f. sp. conglutinans race 2 54008]|uniref:Uncharacterized protein n=1 Tax=Fusarium oxysporum f. sp. conglutinans race 2 54008 TaxID=1089457 RepID=X0H1W5_FUSOX|nr:hypothetical protein FOPG_17742 [Fusarium oxysporum f. sp. conglutinans race 2 54008]